jgi:hypothetical protein
MQLTLIAEEVSEGPIRLYRIAGTAEEDKDKNCPPIPKLMDCIRVDDLCAAAPLGTPPASRT